MNEFDNRISGCCGELLHSTAVEVIQVNLTARCNQQCCHCHLNCSPRRTEEMDWPTMEMVLAAAGRSGCTLVDLTGGAPELCTNFRRFVEALRNAGREVQVRTNLTVMLEPGMAGTAEFLAANAVRLVASLPCYTEENVDVQRGPGVYARSVEVIRRLNALGYGREGGPQLNLLYNPAGAFLPPNQAELQADYRRELHQRFGIEFSGLLTMTNMPIGRFDTTLRRANERENYIAMLNESFNPETVDGLMCRHQICVAWDGTLYDCDFNLALGTPVDHDAPKHIRQFDISALRRRRIVTGEYCFGCTAGCGSSCGGALV